MHILVYMKGGCYYENTTFRYIAIIFGGTKDQSVDHDEEWLGSYHSDN